MNVLQKELARICQKFLLNEKWLVSESLRIGHQMLDAITSRGVPVVNFHVKTVKGLAADLASPEIARRKVNLLTTTGALVLGDLLIKRIRNFPSSYFSSLPPSQSLSLNLFRTLEQLRLAGLIPEDLDPQHFEAVEKRRDLVIAFEEYLSTLRNYRLIDYAELLKIASSVVKAGASILPDDLIVILPEDLELTALEREFFDSFPASSKMLLAVDKPETIGSDDEQIDARKLSWILHPSEAPEAKGDGTVTIFRAIGEANEVRHVLRTCLSLGYRLDEVELLHTDTETYVPLIYEIFCRFDQNPIPDIQTLPVTFAEGIPARYSRPGRALIAFISWSREGYPQAILAQMIQDGLIEVPGKDDGLSFSVLASYLREMKIGWGIDRYVPIIERTIEDLSAADGKNEQLKESNNSKIEALQLLLNLIKQLLAISPQQPASNTEVLQSALLFLENFARRENQLDNYSINAILIKIREMISCSKEIAVMESIDFVDWLLSIPGQIRVAGSSPRPGCLHVAHVLSGGYSDRKYTFVIGLDDGRFPGLGLNDPLMLDVEREKLSKNLPKASTTLKVKLEKFARLMARLRGQVALGFSCHDFKDDRETFASPVVFSAYRIISNNRQGDQAAMLQWLPPPTSFAPNNSEECLDDSEWWLWRLCGDKDVANSRELISKYFPHLGQGFVAAEAREGSDFTVYDGLLPDLPRQLNPFSVEGPVMSTAKLERIGQCPLSYFFKYVLEIKPPEELIRDDTRWLDAVEFGNLLHEVFYLFIRELISQGRLPNRDRDNNLLIKILDEQVEKYKNIFPPPGPAQFERQLAELRHAARIFLIEEEELCRSGIKPKFLETTIAWPPTGSPTILDSHDPVKISFSSGSAIRAGGRIDRIDLLGDESSSLFCVWDYKTGSTYRYTQRDPCWEGRIIQHALYWHLAAASLKKKVSRKAEVAYFGYFFPGMGAKGMRLRRWRNHVEEGSRIIETLCKIVASGCFIATTKDNVDCKYCEYSLICSDTAAVSASAKNKLDASVRGLEFVKELRSIGKK